MKLTEKEKHEVIEALTKAERETRNASEAMNDLADAIGTVSGILRTFFGRAWVRETQDDDK